MLALVLLVACRSHKEATATTKEQYDIEAACSSSIATTSRSQWLSRFSLDIDSFEIEWKLSAEDELARILPKRTLDCAEGEIVIPTHHFAEIGKMVGDTAMDLQEQFALGAVQPALRSVVLRGKHARLGKADIVQRDAARRAEQVDTLSAHRSIDKADHYARDNVGIMKPPDVTWWPWLLLTGLLLGTIIIIWLKERGK